MYLWLIVVTTLLAHGEDFGRDCAKLLDTPVALTTQTWVTRLRGRVPSPRETLGALGLTHGQMLRLLNTGFLVKRTHFGIDLTARTLWDHPALLRNAERSRDAGILGYELDEAIDAAREDARFRSLAEAFAARYGERSFDTSSFVSFLRRLLTDSRQGAEMSFAHIRVTAEQGTIQYRSYWSNGGVRTLARLLKIEYAETDEFKAALVAAFTNLPPVAGYTVILRPQAAWRIRLKSGLARMSGLELADVASVVANGAAEGQFLDAVADRVRVLSTRD